MRLGPLLEPEVKRLLTESPEQLTDLLDQEHPEDIADLLRDLDPREVATALARIPARDGAPIFERLPGHEQNIVASLLPLDKLVYIAGAMGTGRRAHLMRILPEESARTLLQALRELVPPAAAELRTLEQWSPGTAGHMMSTSFITLRASMTATEALAAIRAQDQRSLEVADDLYVGDERGRLVGRVALRELVFTDASTQLADLVHRKVIAVGPNDDRHEIARRMAKYELHVLPVVGDGETLLGMVDIDDVMDALTKETTQAVQRIGAVEPLDLPYFETGFLTFIRKRGVWLFVLFFGEFFTQTALRHYDPVFEAIHGAAYYVPLLISAGGNSGSQSSTLVIRGMAVGEIRMSDWWRILCREAGMGLALGLGLAAVGFFRVLMYPEQHSDFALTVAITLVGIVMTGCTVGAMLPILLKRIGLDPATSSTPFIASLVDVLGIVIFVHVAKVIMATVLAGAHP
jgi:magnesium transporter